MTAAYRLKGLGWFGGCVVMSLGFYLVSLQVAAERRKLTQVEAKIHAADRDIRALETEFDVRANLAQLERWNGDTLALVAPGAGQFVRSEGDLAAISFSGSFSGSFNGGPVGQPSGAALQNAALLVPSLPSYAAPLPVIDETPKPAPAPSRVGLVQVVAKSTLQPAAQPAAPRAAVMVKVARASVKKAQAVAMLDKTLLSDTTLGDLLSGARAETGRLR